MTFLNSSARFEFALCGGVPKDWEEDKYHTIAAPILHIARSEDEFFPAARAAGIGVIAREPLANGFLAGKYAWDSTWEKGDIRARMPRPYVKQMAGLGQRVRELAEKAGTSPTQLALRFVLDQQAVSVAIVGMKTVQQVDENLGWEA